MGTNDSQLLVENPRPYTSIGESFTFYAYYLDSSGNPIQGNGTLLQIVLSNGTANATYNMTNQTTKWAVTVTSNFSESVNVLVNATSNTHVCKTVSFSSKWRTPFYVQFQIYKQPLNSTDPQRYDNDFQYIVLVNNELKNSDDMTIWAFNRGTDKLFNTIFGLVSDFDASELGVDAPDRNIYFWGKYASGSATIKLYEPGNYSVYAMNNKVQYPGDFFWEFERPTTKDVEYMGNIYEKLRIYNQTNIASTPTTYNNTIWKVSLTKYEANAYYWWMNLGIILLNLLAVVVGFIVIVHLLGNSSSGGQVILWYVLFAVSWMAGVIYYVQ